MGWLPQSEFDRLREDAMALTPEERASLTWEDARKFVASDTLEMAAFQGAQKSGCSPWEAVARLRSIPL